VSNPERAGPEVLVRLYDVIETRKRTHPKESRTARLFEAGLPKIAQKVGEEATEVVVASLAQDDRALVGESADLLYHLLVLLAARGIHPDAVFAELAARARE
jgi:phosphoribosyl-ATP pyrophosphohydrolase